MYINSSKGGVAAFALQIFHYLEETFMEAERPNNANPIQVSQ